MSTDPRGLYIGWCPAPGPEAVKTPAPTTEHGGYTIRSNALPRRRVFRAGAAAQARPERVPEPCRPMRKGEA